MRVKRYPPKEALQTLVSEGPDHSRSVIRPNPAIDPEFKRNNVV
jgi:hypothetical protein